MPRVERDIALIEKEALILERIKISLHASIVEILRPTNKIIDRLLRTVGIVNLEAIAVLHDVIGNVFERGGGFLGEERDGLSIAVNAVADEVVS